MFKCLECGKTFQDADSYKESYGQKFDCCPYCKGAIDYAYVCTGCENWFANDELKVGDDGEYYCKDCYERLWENGDSKSEET